MADKFNQKKLKNIPLFIYYWVHQDLLDLISNYFRMILKPKYG